MNPNLLAYIIQNDLEQMNIKTFQIEEFLEVNPTEIKVSKRELVYVHYVNIKDTKANLSFCSDDNHHLYQGDNMRSLDMTQLESSLIHKHLSNIKIESISHFYVRYIKVRF